MALDRKCLIVAVAALTALLGAASAFAQVRASLQVRVTDRSAVPVPSARVALLFDDGDDAGDTLSVDDVAGFQFEA